MLIQGTIVGVEAPDYTDPKYHNQYQNITISTAQGTVEGRIGTKTPYTKADIGKPGKWDSEPGTNSQGPYNQFKKHYDKPYQQQGQQRQPAVQPQGQKPDWDAIALGKVRHGIVCAFIQAGADPTIQQIEYWVSYVMTGKAPLPPTQESMHAHEVDESQSPF